MSNVAPNGVVNPTVESLLGGFIIECLVALVFYGITMAQTYSYTLNSGDDSWLTKTIVGMVALIETVHSGIIMHQIYTHTIQDYGHLERVAKIIWNAGASVLCGLLIVILVQGFYVSRLFILSGRKVWLTTFASALLVLRVAATIAIIVFLYRSGNWGTIRDDFGIYLTVALGLGLFVALDLTIAASLVVFLRKGLSDFSGTQHLVHSLMVFAVNTGVVTTICSIVIFFTFTFLKSSLVFAGFAQILSKLYANSLLGLLNTRERFRHQNEVQLKTSSLPGRISTKSRPGQRLEIFRETTTLTTANHDYPPARPLERADSVSSKAAASFGAEV